ncbi:hypothetical protein ACLEPN_26470 [Myxococcus sp. 1LA]
MSDDPRLRPVLTALAKHPEDERPLADGARALLPRTRQRLARWEWRV